MSMCAQVYGRLCRVCLLCAFCLASGLVVPPAHAFQVADGMALLRQEMPANYCALTFDDGPGPYTANLLDLLAQRGIVATFFVLGHNAERRPALVMRMLAEGHEVANHSYSHADMRRLKPEAQFLEMKKTLDVLHSFGAEVRYFRPPYGRYSQETAAKAEALGMTLMLWSLDSQDWKRQVSRLEGLRSISPVLQQSFPGMRGVFLFHDTHKRTVGEMAAILDALTAAGCERFVTVSEYMSKVPREEEHRLSTQVPNEGRGEMPPPAIAGRLPAAAANGAGPQPPGDTQDRRMPVVSMQTQAAHAVKAPEQSMRFSDMRTLPAHDGTGRSISAAALDALAMGIVTHGRDVPFAQEAQFGSAASFAYGGRTPPVLPQVSDRQSPPAKPPAPLPPVRESPSAKPKERAPAVAQARTSLDGGLAPPVLPQASDGQNPPAKPLAPLPPVRENPPAKPKERAPAVAQARTSPDGGLAPPVLPQVSDGQSPPEKPPAPLPPVRESPPAKPKERAPAVAQARTPPDGGLAPPVLPQASDGQKPPANPPAPLPLIRENPPAKPKARAPAVVQAPLPAAALGRIPRLLSSPDTILPAHKPNKETQDIQRGGSGPG